MKRKRSKNNDVIIMRDNSAHNLIVISNKATEANKVHNQGENSLWLDTKELPMENEKQKEQ